MTSRATLRVLAFCFALSAGLQAAPIAEWNFNSPIPDAETSTGSLNASRGDGVLTLIGGSTATFDVVGGGRTSDPAPSDNSQLRVRSLPRIDASNKSVGVEFTMATLGFENLALSWDQYNSRTASRFWRVQYTTNGTTWTDHQSVISTNASSWVRFHVSFDGVSLANRSYLSIRLVPEFESTATGAGADAYVAVDATATYGTAGSWWIDMVSISGRLIGTTNAPPSISSFSDVILTEGSEAEPIPFTVSDSETSVEALTVVATASNTAVFRDLVLEGTEADRTVRFQAATAGQTEVTIRVTDEEGEFAESSFKVTVVSEEPTLSETNFFVLWHFNGDPPDADASTGTFAPGIGAGSLSVIGTATHNFGSVGQGRTSDPAPSDNSMLRLVSFPRQGEGNKTCGIEISASTVGLEDVALVWDQYNSGSASRYWQIQYTTNGLDFQDHELFTNTTASTWRRARSVRFGNLPGTADNPNFGVRLISSFESDVGYATVSEGANYSTAGTLWLDMVGFVGERIIDQPEPPPLLNVSHAAGLRLSWPKATRAYFLESRESWTASWVRIETPPDELETEFQVMLEPQGEARFFRLRCE